LPDASAIGLSAPTGIADMTVNENVNNNMEPNEETNGGDIAGTKVKQTSKGIYTKIFMREKSYVRICRIIQKSQEKKKNLE
jgi:hypothetical protein